MMMILWALASIMLGVWTVLCYNGSHNKLQAPDHWSLSLHQVQESLFCRQRKIHFSPPLVLFHGVDSAKSMLNVDQHAAIAVLEEADR